MERLSFARSMALHVRSATLPLALAALSALAASPSLALAEPLPSVNLRSFSPSTSPGATFFLEPANVQGAWQTNTSG